MDNKLKKELKAKYGLSNGKIKYEDQQATEKGYSLEEWLKYKYESDGLWDRFIDEWDNKHIDITDIDTCFKLALSFWKSEWMAIATFESVEQDIQREQHGLTTLGNRKKDEILSNFFKVQTHLQNKQFYWFLFNTFYSNFDFPIKYKDDFIKSFNMHDRLSVSLEERVQWTLETIGERHGERTGNEIMGRKNLDNLDKLLDKIKSYKEDDDVILYRGFLVGKDERIMDENKKQITGEGFSYSWDKEKAIAFALRFNWFEDFIQLFRRGYNTVIRDFKNYDKLNEIISKNFKENGLIGEDENIDINWDQFWTNKKFRDKLYDNNLTYRSIVTNIMENTKTSHNANFGKIYDIGELKSGDDVRSYIGKYKIKKNKIISGLGQHMEFVCNPDDVEMISYEIVDIKKMLANTGIHYEKEDID